MILFLAFLNRALYPSLFLTWNKEIKLQYLFKYAWVYKDSQFHFLRSRRVRKKYPYDGVG
tara:strand:+ start:196 stop:375 length:180 start_codon:yes stop_codon:yes gene_type:complete